MNEAIENILVVIIMIVFSPHTNAQQIETNPILGFTKGEAAYNITEKKIYLHWQDVEAVNKFLHELGHHIWYYGGVDTITFKESVEVFEWTNAEIIEQFAHYHCDYWMGLRWNSEADSIFYKFYNRYERSN